MATGFICGPRLYIFKGWFFECCQTGGPWPLKESGSPYKRAGRIFYKIIRDFDKLSEKQKQRYRVGGGCQRF